MTKTGRPKSEEKMIRRTVRNSADVDAVLVRMAAQYRKPLAVVLREACEEKAIRETVAITVDPNRSVDVRMVPGVDDRGYSVLVQEEGEG